MNYDDWLNLHKKSFREFGLTRELLDFLENEKLPDVFITARDSIQLEWESYENYIELEIYKEKDEETGYGLYSIISSIENDYTCGIDDMPSILEKLKVLIKNID